MDPEARKIIIRMPELSLVALIGPSGAGKSMFARKHFLSTEVISSDYCRGLVCDDENSMEASDDAFELVYYIAGKRLKAGRLSVIDATNVRKEDRKILIRVAREHHVIPVAIVFDTPEKLCVERNEHREDRNLGKHVVRNHIRTMRRSMRGLKREGFRHIYTLTPENIDDVRIVREPLWNNKKGEAGPFDIIGDIHGCYDELVELLERLDYRIEPTDDDNSFGVKVSHPARRKLVLLGDLVDRGPRIPDVLRLAMSATNSGVAFCVPGNHDVKLRKALEGKNVQVKHGLECSLEQLEQEPEEFRRRIVRFIEEMISHYLLDGGRLVVAHAGMKEELQGRGSGRVREFALYGETTGETDEFGFPVRCNWALEYRGKPCVAYGHTPVLEAQWLNRTINIDTGCVFGGKLTALRWPEKELVSVNAREQYADPVRPLQTFAGGGSAQQEHDSLLDIEDVTGKRIINTRLMGNITIREENSIAALEAMSRFAIDPRWLIYLPPTMSPCATATEPDYLELPAQAFEHFQEHGLNKIVCQEKHMGSRCIVIVCREEATARSRFGVKNAPAAGVVYSRTGRAFFPNEKEEMELLERLRNALSATGFWEQFNTDWACFDCELMPWSAKARELLRAQYAPAGRAAKNAFVAASEILNQAASNGCNVAALIERFDKRADTVEAYIDAYRRYCWEVKSIDDYRLAPFHLMATEGVVHVDRQHDWHMQTLTAICDAGDDVLMKTRHRTVDLSSAIEVQDAIEWWMSHTQAGGEGKVVKPLDFIARDNRGILQPGIKCRGREYLRIIYGMEYTLSEHLIQLKKRGLGRKRSLAVREFALGVEALERFINQEPLRRVHECVFAVQALESEAVDPRL